MQLSSGMGVPRSIFLWYQTQTQACASEGCVALIAPPLVTENHKKAQHNVQPIHEWRIRSDEDVHVNEQVRS